MEVMMHKPEDVESRLFVESQTLNHLPVTISERAASADAGDMSCEVASWVPTAVAATLRENRTAPALMAWLQHLRDSVEEYDPLITVHNNPQVLEESEDSVEFPTSDSAFDEILSQIGKEIFQLNEYQQHLNPCEEKEVSLSILNLFDQCLGEVGELLVNEVNCDNCEQSSELHEKEAAAITNEVEPITDIVEQITPIMNGNVLNNDLGNLEDYSDCDSTFSDVSFVTSTPARQCDKPNPPIVNNNNTFNVKKCPPVPPRRTKFLTPPLPIVVVPMPSAVIICDNTETQLKEETLDLELIMKQHESDSDSVSTCWSYKECSTDENENNKGQYAVVWSHFTGYHNSDKILQKVLTQNHATISQLFFDSTSEFAPRNSCEVAAAATVAEVGVRCEEGKQSPQSVAVMTLERPSLDDGYEPVRDAITTDENIYEEIEYSYTDEGCSCGGSVEVESCSISASSEGVDRESPVYVNLRDHDAYAIPADVIAWKNQLLDPFHCDDEEDEWITPEECAVYSREQRAPLVIPRITHFRPRHERPLQHAPGIHSYAEEAYQEPSHQSSVKSSVRQYERLHDWSPSSERGLEQDQRFKTTGSDSPPFYRLNKRLGGSSENLLINNNNIRRPNHLQLPASSSGDSLDVEVREKQPVAPRSRKSRSMVAPKQRMRSPVPAPRLMICQPAEAAVVYEGPVKRTKFSESGKKCKKNWNDCYMLLTQTALVFYKDQRTYHASRTPKPAGTPPSPTAPRAELVLPLRNAHVVQCIQMHTRRFTRSLVLTVGYDQYLLQDETEDGAKRWLNRIQNIIFKLGPPVLEEFPTAQYQSSNTDLESLGRTPPVSRHPNRAKQKGGSSNEDLSDSTEISIQKSHVKSRLRKFFARRPAMEVLVKKGIYKDEPVFGRNLDEVCPVTSPRVPDFVVACVREIERSEENMCTDGLYRASGNLSQVQKIRLEIDQNNLSVIEKNPDIHVLTGSLKLFFRELKEPLIPCSMFDRILSACSIKPREARTREFRDIVQALPACNRETLKFLLEHLLRVTQYSEKNRMHTANLAIVFGPTLLWAPAAQAHNIAVDCIQQNNVVDILLTDFKEIFTEENRGKKKS